MTGKELAKWLASNGFKKDEHVDTEVGNWCTEVHDVTIWTIDQRKGMFGTKGRYIRLDLIKNKTTKNKDGKLIHRSNYWSVYAKGKGYEVNNKISYKVPSTHDIETIMKIVGF